MDINDVLNTQELVQNNIAQAINKSNDKAGDAFYLGQKVRYNDSFSFDNDDVMNDLLNNIGLEVQRRGGN